MLGGPTELTKDAGYICLEQVCFEVLKQIELKQVFLPEYKSVWFTDIVF